MLAHTKRQMVRLRQRTGGVGRKLAVSGLIAAGLVVAFLVGVLFNSHSLIASQSTPPVAFDPAEIDLGNVPWNKSVDVSLRLVNKAAEATTISRVASSCGCMAVDAERYVDSPLGSGESREIVARLNTEKTPGPKVRSVSATLADGTVRTATIRVNVIGTWTVSADRVEFPDVWLDASPRPEINDQIVEFRSESDSLSAVGPPTVPWLEAHVDHAAPQFAEIVFRVKPEFVQPGINSTMVILRTTCSEKPDSTIHVRVVGLRSVNVIPERLFLPDDEPRTVRVVDPSGRSLPVKSAESDNSAFGVKAVAGQPGSLTVRRYTASRQAVRGAITVVDELDRRAIVQVTVLAGR